MARKPVVPGSFRPRGEGLERVLGGLERRVMEALWELQSAATVREVLERIRGPVRPAYNTVMTVLLRLSQKELARRRKIAGTWHYEAALSESDLREQVSGEVVRGLLDLAPEATLAQLVDALAEEPDALEELARMIEQKRRRRGQEKEA
jgi:predicted transcriptional regulator